MTLENDEGRSNAAIDMSQGGTLPLPPGDGTDAEMLVYEHPDYVDAKEKWQKFHRLYNSRSVYTYIYKHLREHQSMFENRVKRGYYLNYVAAVVDLYVAYLYHSPITRQPASDGLYEDLYKDADRRGTHYSVLIQQATTHSQVAGHCGILVDMPALPRAEGFANEQERLDAKHRPYLVLVQANQILDWKLDRDGKFDWVKIEVVREQERDWRGSVDENLRFFQIWTKSTWEEWKVTQKEGQEKPEKAELVARGDHPLGAVPLVIFRNEVDLDHAWFGVSAIRDISDLNIAILNWCSLMDEEIYERCLNILTVQKSVGDESASFTLGHNNVLQYEGEQVPSYLVPGATPLQLIMEAIDRLKDEIYRLAKLGGDTGLQKSRAATSGIAYAFEFNTTNQSLGKKAESAQQAEVEIHRLFAKWTGQEFVGTISYPKEFGVEDFLQDLALLAEGRSTLSSPTAIKKLEQRISAKMFAREEQKLRDTIANEIETTDPQDPILLNTSLGFGPPEPPEEEGPVGGPSK